MNPQRASPFSARGQVDYYKRAGSRSIVYGLASRGAAHLRRVDNTPFARINWTAKNRDVKRLFLEHALMVSDIMVALEIACQKHGEVRLLIEHDIPLPESSRHERDPFRWRVTVRGNQSYGVIPDRVFALEFTERNERILFFLEADRGTMPIARTKRGASCIARKLEAYEATWSHGIHRSRFGFPRIRALTLCASRDRANRIRALTESVHRHVSLFHTATLGDVIVSPEQFLASQFAN